MNCANLPEKLRHYAGNSPSLRFLDKAADAVEQRERLIEALRDAACQITDLADKPGAAKRYDDLLAELESEDG